MQPSPEREPGYARRQSGNHEQDQLFWRRLHLTRRRGLYLYAFSVLLRLLSAQLRNNFFQDDKYVNAVKKLWPQAMTLLSSTYQLLEDFSLVEVQIVLDHLRKLPEADFGDNNKVFDRTVRCVFVLDVAYVVFPFDEWPLGP